jgi:hypothetical protein
MQLAGVQVDSNQILQGLLIKEKTGKDGKKFEIATTDLNPDPKKQGEDLEGNYPLMIKTEKGWEEATLKNIAQKSGMEFGAFLNLNADFHSITVTTQPVRNSNKKIM